MVDITKPIRNGIKDVWWRPYMVSGAIFTHNDIPFCPTTAQDVPDAIITYKEAKAIYSRELRKGNRDFHYSAFVCFYEDDWNFDSISGIWFRSSQAYKILRHFDGIITPDFSTYQDFPYPIKLWNTYRMRAFGYWYGILCGGNVINNVRWGTSETFNYCFDGIPKNSIVAIGTNGGSPRYIVDRTRFEQGLMEMINVLSPHTIIVYGSANYNCFKELKTRGINIISYPSSTSVYYARRAAV